MNTTSIEKKQTVTNEFILLGILAVSENREVKLQRMQIMKILQKTKTRLQDELNVEGYHNEFIKDKHGDFDSNVYTYLTDLKQADLITSQGFAPYEKFYATELGKEIFNTTKFSSGSENKKLKSVKKIIHQTIRNEAHKTSEQLREENHNRKIQYNGKAVKMDDLDDGVITTSNIKSKSKFLFDDRLTMDWFLYKKIAIRKRERVTPDKDIPKTQNEIYALLNSV